MSLTDSAIPLEKSAQNTTKKEIIRKNKMLIDSVRRCQTSDKTLLAKISNTSWPTINNFLSSYTNNNKPGHDLIINENDKYVVNPSYATYLGIAVGARETKVTLIGMSFDKPTEELSDKYGLEDFFERLKGISKLIVKRSSQKNMVCFETKNELWYLSHMCNEIIKVALEFFAKSCDLNLLGIGITFPGIIDKKDLKVSFCPNISCLNGVYLLNVLYDEILEDLTNNSISLCIAHDTLAITVYEKENLYKRSNSDKYKNRDNVVCLYLGVGLGLGVIINDQLLTGNNNSVGEIGHIASPSIELLDPQKVFASEESQSCNETEKYNYDYNNYKISDKIPVENRINVEDAERCHCRLDDCIERMIRTNVFNSTTIEQYIQKTQSEYLEHFDEEHPYRYAVLKHYLSYLFNIIINLFNPDLLILCGKLLNSINALRSDKYALKQSTSIFYPASNCEIINGDDSPDCVAIGAAILSYYKLVESDGTNNTTGMQFNISWNKIP